MQLLSYQVTMMITDNIVTPEAAKATDALALGSVVTSLFGILPELLQVVSLIFAVVWTGIRIYETETVQTLIRKVRK